MMISNRFAAATMLGLSVLSVGACTTPPPPEPAVQVMLLDEFPSAQDTMGVSHGTLVEAVLRSRSPIANERVQVPLGNSLQEVEQGRPGALERYVVQRFRVPTEATAQVLERLHKPGVASQSQGASESRVVESLWGAAQGKAATRTFLENELEIPSGSSDADFLQALVRRVDDIHHGNREIGAARRHLLQAARTAQDAGVIRVVSAGNQGHLEQLFDRLGVLTGRDFYMSDLADPGAIVVGASDNRGTVDPSDDGPASLASPDAGALIGTQGVDVPIQVNGQLQHHSGSSYAQPQIASLIAGWKQENPGMTRDEVVDRLLRQVHPIAGAEPQIGAGIIENGWFLRVN